MGFLSAFMDPAKLEPLVTKCFAMFDTDKSGFIEQAELVPVATKVCSMAGMAEPPMGAINKVFARAGGPDGKVSKEEFSVLVKQLFAMVDGKKEEEAGHHAAAAGTTSTGGTGGSGYPSLGGGGLGGALGGLLGGR